MTKSSERLLELNQSHGWRGTAERSSYTFLDSLAEGTPPPPSPSYRRILVGTLCFCVPTLLLSNWHTTHQWNFNTGRAFPESSYFSEANVTQKTLGADLVHDNIFHFCEQSRVTARIRRGEGASADYIDQNESLSLLYQCSGPDYDAFTANLRQFVNVQSAKVSFNGAWKDNNLTTDKCNAIFFETTRTHSHWGRRPFPLPDNKTVLAMGNSHLRQISETMACQYASSSLSSIQFFPSLLSMINSNSTEKTSSRSQQNSDAFVLEFENGSRWISITNTVLAYSSNWKQLLEELFLSSLTRPPRTMIEIDAVVLGKFTRHAEAINTNFEQTMAMEQYAYHELRRQQRRRQNFRNQDDRSGSSATKERRASYYISTPYRIDDAQVDFVWVAPPDLVDVAQAYQGPIISVNMFSKSDESRFLKSYQNYCENQSERQNQNIYLVNGRRYIQQLNMECGTDDKIHAGTCHEPNHQNASGFANTLSSLAETQGSPTNRTRDPSNMHRCAGKQGGHADLIAWDIIEGLYAMLGVNGSEFYGP